MTEQTRKQVVIGLQSDFDALLTTENSISVLKVSMNRQVAEIVAEFAPKIDALTKTRDILVDLITLTFSAHRDLLTRDGGKTVVFRSGTLSAKLSPASLEIKNESLVMKLLRQFGELRNHTIVGKRTIDKKALKANPALVARLRGAAQIVQVERLTIKLPDLALELVRDLHPLRRDLKS